MDDLASYGRVISPYTKKEKNKYQIATQVACSGSWVTSNEEIGSKRNYHGANERSVREKRSSGNDCFLYVLGFFFNWEMDGWASNWGIHLMIAG